MAGGMNDEMKRCESRIQVTGGCHIWLERGEERDQRDSGKHREKKIQLKEHFFARIENDKFRQEDVTPETGYVGLVLDSLMSS